MTIKRSDTKIASLIRELFNRMTLEQKNSVPDDAALEIGDFMRNNGYRMVFEKWYLQKKPSRRKGN